MTPKLTPEQFRASFWKRVHQKKNGCWEWTGKISNYGYGKCHVQGKEVMAHRMAYELAKGPVPDGMVLDHICRNRRCVNPAHLEPVTSVENVLRGEGFAAKKKRQTHCIHGHLLNGDNLKIRKNGTRYCLACERERVISGYYRERYRRNAHRNVMAK